MNAIAAPGWMNARDVGGGHAGPLAQHVDRLPVRQLEVARRLGAAQLHQVDARLVGDLVHLFDRLVLEHADDERALAGEQPVERLGAVREPRLDRVEAARMQRRRLVLLHLAQRRAGGAHDLPRIAGRDASAALARRRCR